MERMKKREQQQQAKIEKQRLQQEHELAEAKKRGTYIITVL